METLSEEAARYIAQALVTSFSPHHCSSKEVVDFINRVVKNLPLSREHLRETIKLLHKHSSSGASTLLGKYEISRIAITDVLPDVPYQEFVKKLNTSSILTTATTSSLDPAATATTGAGNIQLSIQRFVTEFNTKYPPKPAVKATRLTATGEENGGEDEEGEGEGEVEERKASDFHAFVDTLSAQLHDWFGENTEECVEYHLTTLLYNVQFPRTATTKDFTFSQRVAALQFVTMDHLEVSRSIQERIPWDYAVEALLKIQLQKTPHDKIKCIFECFKIIARGLSDSGHGGADDLLPCVIYAILKANPPQMHSNLKYITTFRSPTDLGSQSGYFCVTLYAAVMFIENLSSEQLLIDPDLFRHSMSMSTALSSSSGGDGDGDGDGSGSGSGSGNSLAGSTSELGVTSVPEGEKEPEAAASGEKNLESYLAEAVERTHISEEKEDASTVGREVEAHTEGEQKGGTNAEPLYSAKRTGPVRLSHAPIFEDDVLSPETPLDGLMHLGKNIKEKNRAEPIKSVDASLQGVDVASILLALIAIAVSEKIYDARIRVALRRMSKKLSITTNELFLKLEERFVQSLASVSESATTSSTASSFRIAKVLLAAAAGGTALALTGGLAAPLVGHLFGMMGLSALISALTASTGVSGVALVGILCGAAGAGVTAGQMARKTAGLEEFEFLRVQVKKKNHNKDEKNPTKEEAPKKFHDEVLDNIKVHMEHFIQKTKSIGKKENAKEYTALPKDKEMEDKGVVDASGGGHSEEPTKSTEDGSRPSNSISEETSLSTETSGAQTKDNEGGGDQGSKTEDGGGEAVADGDATEVIYTEHNHYGNNQKNTTSSNSNNRSAGGLVVGTQLAFKGLHAVVGIPGWANGEKEECVCDIWARALHNATMGMGDSFVLMWESQYLRKIGVDLRKLHDVSEPSHSHSHSTSSSTPGADSTTNTTDGGQSLAKSVANKMIYHSLLSTTVLHEISVVDSPWVLVRDRAEKAGILLAQTLMNGVLGARPVTLIGISMGARVIFNCLEELCRMQDKVTQSNLASAQEKTVDKIKYRAKEILSRSKGGKEEKHETEKHETEKKEEPTNEKTMVPPLADRDPSGIIENVIFIGAAVPSDIMRFAAIRRVVAGRLINCYNSNDYTLSVIYRTAHWITDGLYHPPAGVTAVPSHPRYDTILPIENVNMEDLVSSHMDYQKETVLTSILETVGCVF